MQRIRSNQQQKAKGPFSVRRSAGNRMKKNTFPLTFLPGEMLESTLETNKYIQYKAAHGSSDKQVMAQLRLNGT